jgi:predicted negative regulator of RcsB-dependent stress response
VDDYLSEKEQWEWLKAQIKESAPWVVAAVVAGVLIVSGWRWWQGRADRLAVAASAQYQQIIDAFGRGDRARALALIDALGRDQPKSPYIDQANLGAARVFVIAGELDKAATRLKTVMDHTPDHVLALVARERLARVQIAQGAPDAALATLAAVDPGSFAPRFHEVRADAFEAKKDFPAALKEYRVARAADASGIVDPESLDLKIGDLVADDHASSAAAPPGK